MTDTGDELRRELLLILREYAELWDTRQMGRREMIDEGEFDELAERLERLLRRTDGWWIPKRDHGGRAQDNRILAALRADLRESEP